MKQLLTGRSKKDGEDWEEKADQIRLYSGAGYTAVNEAPAGTVCAVTGLEKTYSGRAWALRRTPESRFWSRFWNTGLFCRRAVTQGRCI